MAKRKLTRVWISDETLKNIKLKQMLASRDYGVRIPKITIMEALSRQPLIPEHHAPVLIERGQNLVRMIKRRPRRR